MKKLSLIIIALLVAMVCCKKTPQVNIQYVDVEREVLTIGATTANIQCDYEYIATLKSAKLYYGRSESNMRSVNMRVVQSALYAEITGLSASTTYKYYYEFENGFNSMQSEVKTFVTENSSSIVLPTIITADISGITNNSAVCGGQVTDNGGGNVTARGVCWSISANPTISDSHTIDGSGLGTFTSNMTSLSSNTTYHVRAYATNESGTAYGLEKTFTTLNGGGGDVPPGAINGLFTINENGDQVYFSQGNLQYQASTNTWRFAEHQWDFIGGVYLDSHYGTVYENGVKCDNSLISDSYNGWIDLFGWGTSGWANGNVYYQPYNYEYSSYDNGWGYGPTDGTYYTYSLTGVYNNADWGVYNSIINGGNTPNEWRVLTTEEWVFVFDTRSTLEGIRYAKAQVNNVNGMILLPDNWNNGTYGLNSPDQSDVNFGSNVISATQWATLQNAGAVFLPTTGQRVGHWVEFVNSEGHYWSASHCNFGDAYRVNFGDTEQGHCYMYTAECSTRYFGEGVRLVQDANK